MHRRSSLLLAAGLAFFVLASPAAAQSPTGDGGHGAVPLTGRAEGAPIGHVTVVLAKGSGNPSRDEAIVARLRQLLDSLEGRLFSRAAVEGRLAEPRRRMGLGWIDYAVVSSDVPGSIDIRVEVDTPGGGESGKSVARGLVTGDSGAFPLLYQDNSALFTTILAGGFGAYSDLSPWFGQPLLFNKGSPIAGHLPGSQAAWTEGFVEAGLGGASQIGNTPFYAYGAITALTSWSLGQDIYTDAPRSDTSIEKGYGGVLYVDPESGASLNVSAGRQNVTLNDGLLVHFVRGSANIGPRGGTYLGPRNANDFSVVIDGKAGPWSIKAFYIDPNELESIESKTTFEGVNLRYAFAPDFSADGTYIIIPASQSSYIQPGGARLPREGLETLAAHLRWVRPFGIDGVWFETEGAHQTNENFPMSAWAAYGLAGYRASMLPWTPTFPIATLMRAAMTRAPRPLSGTIRCSRQALETGSRALHRRWAIAPTHIGDEPRSVRSTCSKGVVTLVALHRLRREGFHSPPASTPPSCTASQGWPRERFALAKR